MKSTRIAAVSTDGQHVDDHFGRADRFLIYDVKDDLKFVEERFAERLSEDDPNHPFDAGKFNRIASLLKDCRKVYVTRIGKVPEERLNQLGIEPVVYLGPIADIVKQ